MGRATSRTTDRAKSRTTGRATRRAAGPRHASGRQTALRTGPPGCTMRRAAGSAARRTNYSVTAPLDLRTTPIQTNGHRGPAPLECTAGFMYRTLGLRLGVRLGLLESTTHRWTGQLGPCHPPAPARTCGIPSCRLALMGPNPCAHLHDPPSSQHGLPRQLVVELSSSKAGSLATLTYLTGYQTKIS